MGRKLLVSSLLIAVAVMLGIVSWAAFKYQRETNPRKALKAGNPMPVRAATASVRTIEDVIGANGLTKEIETVALTARITQPITSVRVSIGDRIKRDQVLLTFDSRVFEATVAEARERERNCASNLDYAELNYQRQMNLYNQHLIARIDVEKADTAVKAARLDKANAALLLEKAQQDLANTVVKSPVDGIVLDRPVNAGETPRVDASVITIGLIDSILLCANVSETRLASVHTGQTATVVFDSFRNVLFSGELLKIDPTVDPKTRTFLVFIKIPNQDYKLTPGLTGFARIKNARTTIAVPSAAVLNPVGEATSVFLLGPDNIAVIKRINTGVSAGGYVEVLDGLIEGDRVITAGIQYLSDGQRVAIMEEGE